MKVTTMVKSILFATAMIIGLQLMAPKAEAATVCAIDCVKLKAAYALLVKKFGVNSKVAKVAKAYLDKVCPPAPPQETLYECSVFDPGFITVRSVELTPSNIFTNISSSTNKIACMSQVACTSYVYNRFVGNGPTTSTRCNNGDPAVVRLTDAQVQTYINATP